MSSYKARFLAMARRLRIVGVIIFILIIAAGAYEVYGILRESTGMNPSRTSIAYFDALGRGDYARVYALTAKADLADIYGRPVTEAAFTTQLRQLVGEQVQPFSLVEAKKLFETRGRLYFAVTLHSQVGGAARESRVVVEVRREDGNWVLTYPFGIIQ